ncbi:citrinin biosynthesis oxydoreductase CtnB [Pochonia chlamydosporia 170]|uniref:Citrinin biosynthesis oxydoreductase CtnB n=1 Tax=Pochonia chlamydosporia 170 TaxID=1380566 RepID=A0A179FX12_METCM|nr:citrinin biosynthesis oxydoreductase CtnB [Pochonia chlamydosporia 170]OAQ69651.1 citrinin biosynthesis oxydoreductase CtnB [Pochonia chlamydosporia 170]
MTVDDNLSLPRILCLHGGGVNAQTFRLQCRTISAQLAHTFRLVFMDAPYPSNPHKDIVAFFGDLAPFYRWQPWNSEQPELPPTAGAEDIMNSCLAAMDQDPGSGPWAGVLGFSQGAKVAISLLWAQQRAETGLGRGQARTQFKFGVIMAGSAPIIHLDLRLPKPRHIADAAILSTAFEDYPRGPQGHHVLRIPTLHVHGLQDEGLDRHRRLLELYCQPDTTRLVEWDAGHRLPVKTVDAQVVVDEMLALASETGAIKHS